MSTCASAPATAWDRVGHPEGRDSQRQPATASDRGASDRDGIGIVVISIAWYAYLNYQRNSAAKPKPADEKTPLKEVVTTKPLS